MNDEGQPSRRGAKRDSLFLATDLFTDAGRPLGRARVRNLSATGLMAECDAMLQEGDRLELVLRGVDRIAASVSWVRGNRIGVVFDSVIDPRVVRRQVGSSASTPPAFTPARFPRPVR